MTRSELAPRGSALFCMKYEKGSFITVPTSSLLGIGIGPQSLYMWLCSYANNSGSCFPSRATLASNMGCSERAVDGYLQELITLGLVIKEQRFHNNKQVSNNYYLPLGVAKSARGVAESAPTPSQNLRTELNPVLTQSREIYMIDENAKKPKTNLEGFGQFKEVYPKRMNLAAASAEWRKLSPEDKVAALEDIPKRARSSLWKDPKYIPMPSNYLRDRRWEDELPKSVNRVTKI